MYWVILSIFFCNSVFGQTFLVALKEKQKNKGLLSADTFLCGVYTNVPQAVVTVAIILECEVSPEVDHL